jgi:hypothetical protein
MPPALSYFLVHGFRDEVVVCEWDPVAVAEFAGGRPGEAVYGRRGGGGGYVG